MCGPRAGAAKPPQSRCQQSPQWGCPHPRRSELLTTSGYRAVHQFRPGLFQRSGQPQARWVSQTRHASPTQPNGCSGCSARPRRQRDPPPPPQSEPRQGLESLLQASHPEARWLRSLRCLEPLRFSARFAALQIACDRPWARQRLHSGHLPSPGSSGASTAQHRPASLGTARLLWSRAVPSPHVTHAGGAGPGRRWHTLKFPTT